MTHLLSAAARRLTDTLGELKARVREAIAGETGQAVGRGGAAGRRPRPHRRPARTTRCRPAPPARPTRGTTRTADRWADPGEWHDADDVPPPPLPEPSLSAADRTRLAVAAGLAAGRWVLSRGSLPRRPGRRRAGRRWPCCSAARPPTPPPPPSPPPPTCRPSSRALRPHRTEVVTPVPQPQTRRRAARRVVLFPETPMTATLNGRPPRKQLGDQLDRLDSILDVLADALPAAVADACKEGAKQAMKEVVLELLTNPDVRALLAGGITPPPTPAKPTETKPNWWQTLKAKLTQWKDAALDRATAAVQAVTLTARMLTAVLPLKRIALVTLGVGLAVGLTALLVYRFCPPAVAAAVSGVGAAVTAAVAQAAGALRKGRLAAPPAEVRAVGNRDRPAGRTLTACQPVRTDHVFLLSPPHTSPLPETDHAEDRPARRVACHVPHPRDLAQRRRAGRPPRAEREGVHRRRPPGGPGRVSRATGTEAGSRRRHPLKPGPVSAFDPDPCGDGLRLPPLSDTPLRGVFVSCQQAESRPHHAFSSTAPALHRVSAGGEVVSPAVSPSISTSGQADQSWDEWFVGLAEGREIWRRVSSRKKGSKRRRKAVTLLAKAHQKVQRHRQDFHHKTALELVRANDVMYHEDLQTANLLTNHHLAKSIQEAGWRAFVSILAFKAVCAGKWVVAVPPAYTSQRCSGCAVVVSTGLSVRWHACPDCGTSLQRDHNAARNIERLGQSRRGGVGVPASENRSIRGAVAPAECHYPACACSTRLLCLRHTFV